MTSMLTPGNANQILVVCAFLKCTVIKMFGYIRETNHVLSGEFRTHPIINVERGNVTIPRGMVFFV